MARENDDNQSKEENPPSVKERIVLISILFLFVFVIWLLVEGKKKFLRAKRRKKK